MPAALRLTQELVHRLPARVDERGPVRWPDPPDAYCRETTAGIVAAVPPGGELWVFAIGSLIWKPRFPVVERRPAVVRGWHRAFCLGPDTRFRGCPAAPGLMLSLDRGGQCRGVALRMGPEDPAAALEALLWRMQALVAERFERLAPRGRHGQRRRDGTCGRLSVSGAMRTR